MVESEKHNFFVPSANVLFNERQKSIFNVLDEVEKGQPQNRYTAEELEESEIRLNRAVTGSKRETKQFLGKESIFKRPEAPLGRKRKMPDFKKNPHKWTKYSLEDVHLDEMTDKSNSATAMAFLKELSDRNKDPDGPDRRDKPEKIIFNKHVKLLSESSQEADPDKPTFIAGKYVMPEYSVGQKAKPKKTTEKRVKEKPQTQIKLDHLNDVEEEM